MNLEQIETALNEALPLRVPGPPRRDGSSGSARAHIERLEDYMLRSAYANGTLVEARHWLRAVEGRLTDEWEALSGWEVALRRRRAAATAAEIKEAKAKTAPQLYDALRKARSLRESVTDQIARFEREERVVSRAYTMATGG